MSHSQTKKITKFKSRHPEGHKKYSAQKELDRPRHYYSKY
jgi:hypothetical protein